MTSASEIKRALKDAGLEVYRTRGEVVHVAERVRENLLMDAQVFVRASPFLIDATPPHEACVGFVVRAQRSDFPNDGEDHLFGRARRLASAAIERGYCEITNQFGGSWTRAMANAFSTSGARCRSKCPSPTSMRRLARFASR